MFIYVSGIVIFLYLFIRLILPLPCGRAYKSAATLLLLAVSQGHLVKRLWFGGLASPELPPFVLMLHGWLYICLLILCLGVLARDALRLGKWLALAVAGRPRRKAKAFVPERRRFLTAGLGALPAACGARQALLSGLIMLPTAYGVARAVEVPKVRDTTALLANLPPELDGLNLVQISDMHVSPLLREDWVGALVERINGLNADVIVFTGDLVDGLPAERADSVALLRKLKARHGIFACAGNHEYFGNFSAWMEQFADLGLTMLLNEHRVLGINGRELVLAGVTDIVAERFSLPLPDVARALDGAPQGAVRVLLDHRPGQAPYNAKAGIDLQLSGHTHGGHILGMDEIVARFNNGFVRGWYNVKGMPLYVSSGAGLWNGFPVRLGVPPEIARVTLRRAPVTRPVP